MAPRRARDPEPPDELPASEEAEEVLPFEEELGEAGSVDVEQDEDPSLSLLRAFGDPPEWRTMAKHPPTTVHLAAAVLAKGRFLKSTLREEYVKNLFLMSRSTDGYGSEQMVRVATREQKPRASAIRRFFGLGNKEAGQ